MPAPVDVHIVFREFADMTSMHGVPRIINARSVPARIFWSIICLGAFGMFLWQSTILLGRYFSYPKKVNVEIVQKPIPFPSVSVCNTDHMDLLVVKMLNEMFKFTPDGEDYLLNGTYDDLGDGAPEDYNGHYNYENMGMSESNMYPGDPMGTEDPVNSTEFEAYIKAFRERYDEFWLYSSSFFNMYLKVFQDVHKVREDMFEVSSRLGLSANIGPELASQAGVKLRDFIIHCRFMDEECNINTDFQKYFDPYFFNCFTFQPETILPGRATRLQGVEYGLSLLLFAGSAGQVSLPNKDFVVPGMQENDPSLASGRGGRVVVHSPNTMPHPTAEGYDIPPGFSVNLGVKARENVRIRNPHGNCSDMVTQTVWPNQTFEYTLITCQNNCIQKKIMETCECVDNRIEAPPDIHNLSFCFTLPDIPPDCQDFNDFNSSTSPNCEKLLKNWSQRLECKKKVYESMTISDPSSMDECQCFPPCNDIVYDVSYSLSKLPERSDEHTAFYSPIHRFLENFPEEKKDILLEEPDDNHKGDLVNYVSRLNVHIADSNIIKTSESPDYEAIRLISDIGGQLGLWIGISVMTLFEVLQLLADVLRYLTSRTGLGRRRKPSKHQTHDRISNNTIRFGNGDRFRASYRDYLDHVGSTERPCEIDKLTTV